MQNSDLESYVDLAGERGADDAVIIDPSSVCTASWVRMKCRFGCRGYGLRPSCPPHTPDHDRARLMLDSYARANGLPIEVVRSHDQERDVYGLVLIE